MSDEVDNILDVIDGGLQSSTENGYEVRARDGCCTRCVTRPLVEGSDFCEQCRAFLLGDGPDPKGVGRVIRLGGTNSHFYHRDAVTGRYVEGGHFGPDDVDPLHDPGQHLSLHNRGRAIDITHAEDLVGMEHLEQVERRLEQAYIRLHTQHTEGVTEAAAVDLSYPDNDLPASTQAWIRLHTNGADLDPVTEAAWSATTEGEPVAFTRSEYERSEHEGNWINLEDAESVTWVQTEEGGDLVNAEPITWSAEDWESGLIVEGVAWSTPEGMVVLYAEEWVSNLIEEGRQDLFRSEY